MTQKENIRIEVLRKRIEGTIESMDVFEENFRGSLISWISDFLGTHWALNELSSNAAEFVMYRKDGTRAFGASILVKYQYEWGWSNDEKSFTQVRVFEANVGSTGKFPIPTCGPKTERALFYIDLGKFLSDQGKMEELKNMLFNYADMVRGFQKRIRESKGWLSDLISQANS